MNKFFGRYKIIKVYLRRKDNLNFFIFVKEIEFLILNFFIKKNLCLDGFFGKFF